MLETLRSLLFVPGNQPRRLDKAPGTGADALVLDLEDSVPRAEKDNARRLVRDRLDSYGSLAATLLVRVNALNTGLTADDIAAVVGGKPRGLVVPKVQGVDDLVALAVMLAEAERRASLVPGSVAIIAEIETAGGVLSAAEIAGHARMSGITLGAEDFCTDMGVPRTKEAMELLLPRATLALCARAAEIQALDVVFADFGDEEGLRREARFARGIGFSGKFAIHPNQIAPINDVFTPSQAEIDQARRVVEAFESGCRAGVAAVNLDGKMVDTPIYSRAKRLLSLALRPHLQD